MWGRWQRGTEEILGTGGLLTSKRILRRLEVRLLTIGLTNTEGVKARVSPLGLDRNWTYQN